MKFSITLLSAALSLVFCSFVTNPGSGNTNIHASFDLLLKKHVSASGKVNYSGLKLDKTKLNNYIETLQNNLPTSNWRRSKTLAFWINTYNAFTLQLMISHWPVKSIKEIKKEGKGPWDIRFIKIGGKTYSLNDIEHNIIRAKFNEPRIHFAVNCASKGCPVLLNRAYTASNLESLLHAQTKKFINDPSKNKLSTGAIQISKLFDWYKSDFTKKGDLIDFINQYTSLKISKTAKISYMPYSWAVNN